jgi:hypothetical protein
VPFYSQYKYCLLVFVVKNRSFFKLNSDIHGFSARYDNDFHLPSANLKLLHRLHCSLWNGLLVVNPEILFIFNMYKVSLLYTVYCTDTYFSQFTYVYILYAAVLFCFVLFCFVLLEKWLFPHLVQDLRKMNEWKQCEIKWWWNFLCIRLLGGRYAAVQCTECGY